ncbi:MAG: dihydrofolate reductase family protein [Nitrosopumilus sp.]
MTKILAYIASSLDGYVAREDGSIDWLPESSESSYETFYKSVDTVIMGKTTYDQVLTFGEYPYKDKKSFVFTRTSKDNDDNVEFVSDVEKFVKDGFPGAGENIWLVGGAKTILSFLKLGVVDEIIITIIPVLLGTGISLFQNVKNKIDLELINTGKYGQLVDLHYKVLK